MLTVSTPVLGVSNDVAFDGDSGIDSVLLRVVSSGSSAGLLSHNLGGRFGFNSGLDLDSITPGDQTRLVSDLTSLSYSDLGKNDSVSFDTSNVFAFAAANVSINAGTIIAKFRASISSDDGVISLIADRNIVLNSESSLTTVDGGITLSANATGTAVGDFNGLEAIGSTIQTTGTGNISLNGGGGDDSSTGSHYGVLFNSGASLSSTSNGANAGTITINGTGGDGTSNSRGVFFTATGTGPTSDLPKVSVTSVNGDISITGRGGDGAGNGNWGIQLSNVETISSTGTGVDAAKITINGTGGAGVSNNLGVYLAGSSTDITSVDGDITIIGQGMSNGTGSDNLGIRTWYIDTISSTGTGPDAAKITIDGTGGDGWNSNSGVSFGSNPDITTVDGDISIIGQGGNGGGGRNNGLDGGAAISSAGTGVHAAKVLILGHGGDGGDTTYGVNLSGTWTSVDGDINVTGIGGSEPTKGHHTGVNSVSTISSTGTGLNAAAISIHGTGGIGTSNNRGVVFGGAITSVDGAISITGKGGDGSGTNNHGALLTGEIRSTGLGESAATITLDGTGGAGGGRGLYLDGVAGLTSVDGAISLTGQGGNGSFNHNYGVSLVETIESTGTGEYAATIKIDGTGGAGAAANYGVYIAGATTDVTSTDGAISITGQGGGDGSEKYNYGVYVNGIETIKSKGSDEYAATIKIDGTGGNGTRSNDGVYVVGSNTVLTSVIGNILVTGLGTDNSRAVSLNHGLTSSTGTGADAATITVTSNGSGKAGDVGVGTATSKDGDIAIIGGTDSSASAGLVTSEGMTPDAATITITNAGNGGTIAGSATSAFGNIRIVGGSDSYAAPGNVISTGTTSGAATITITGGYVFNANSNITSVVGNIEITGTGRSTSSQGVIVRNSTISSTGINANAATITINGTGSEAANRSEGVLLRDMTVTSEVGNISITGQGGGAGSSSSNTGVYLDDAQVTSTGTETNAAAITIDGTGGSGSYSNYGVYVRDATAAITSVAGAISITGRGGHGSGDNNFGVFLASIDKISSTGTGPIEIDGTGGNGVSANHGVYSVSSSVASKDGAVSIIGKGGNGLGRHNHGVSLAYGSQLSSTGTAPITVDGTGGNGSDRNYGVEARNSASITSMDGDIAITGQGGSGGWGVGTSLDTANISSTGVGPTAATIDIVGTGGTGGTQNRGVELKGSTSLVTSVDGDIFVAGQGGDGSEGFGIIAHTFGTISSTGTGADAATITLNGTSTTNNGIFFVTTAVDTNAVTSVDGDIAVTGQTLSGTDVYLPNVVGGPSATGDITINADTLCFCYTTSVQSTGNLTIQPRTSSTDIGVGGTTGDLRLSDTSLSYLADGFSSITIGDVNNGTGTVNIDTATFTDPVIIAGGTINDNAGTDIDAGDNSVTLVGSVSPGQSPGILDVSGNLVLADNDSLDVEIGGASPGNATTDHDQLDVIGTVTIGTEVTLDLSSFAGFTPLEGQQYVIIKNDGTDAINGTFDGLPEGTLIPDFLGSSLNAIISYLGADAATGNDVVLFAVDNSPPTADAGGPYTVAEGDSIQLDASASTDPDGDSLTFSWDANGDGTFGDATGATPSLTWAQLQALGIDDDGTFNVSVRADDGVGGTHTDATTLTVNNAAPLVNVGSDTTVDQGDTFSASGTFSDPGADTWNATVNYSDGSGDLELTLNPDKTFDLSHTYTSAGFYTVTVTVQDDDGGVGADTLSVVVNPTALPDFVISSPDISFSPINPGVGQSVTINATVKNRGLASASDIAVSFQIFDAVSQAFVEVGRDVISSVAAEDTAQASFSWDGANAQLAFPSAAGFFLVKVQADPDGLLDEDDEANNEASQVLQVGSPDFSSAVIVGNASPSSSCRSETVMIAGQAFYDFDTVTGQQDFPVQGARVTVRVIDPNTQQVLSVFSGAHTRIGGDFAQAIGSPVSDGTYVLHVEISDSTLTSEFQTTLNVSGECSIPVPSSPGPPAPGFVFSSDIQFNTSELPPGNPQLGDLVTITGFVHYELEDPLLDIPVTINDIFPVAGELQTFLIGDGFVSFPDGGAAANGPLPMPVNWTPTAEGFHIIQLVTDPPLTGFRAHTAATRLILVGTPDVSALAFDHDAPTMLVDADSSGGISPGDTLQYTINYENTGTTDITGAVIIDDFDETLLGVPQSVSGSGVVSESVVTWNVGAIAAGTSGSVTYEVELNPAAVFPPGTIIIANTAVLNADHTAAATTVEVVVTNSVPVITGLSVDSLIDENGIANLTGTFSDASLGDTHTVNIVWGDGGTDSISLVGGERSFAINHQYVDNSPASQTVGGYVISVTVIDDAGQQDTAARRIRVRNVAPVGSLDGPHLLVHGEPATYTFGADDVIADQVSFDFVVDWGDGSVIEQFSGPAGTTRTHTYEYAGGYTVQVTATDKDGGTSETESLAVSVDTWRLEKEMNTQKVILGAEKNVLKTKVHAKQGSLEIYYNDDLLVTFTDPNIVGVEFFGQDGDDEFYIDPDLSLDGGLTFLSTELHGGDGDDILQGGSGQNMIDGGDGSDVLIGGTGINTVIGGGGSNTFVDGGGTNIFEVAEGSTVPTVFADSHLVDEGSSLNIAANAGVLANDVSPSADALSAVLVDSPDHASSFSLNTDGSFSYTAEAGFNGTDSFTYLAQNSGGVSTPATVTITVDNVAPTVVVDGPDDAVRGQTVFLSGSFTDPGVLDTHTVGIAWGDGAVDAPSSSGSFAGSHIYTTAGEYSVVVTVTDDDGGETIVSDPITVSIIAMQGVDLAVGGTTNDDHIQFTPGPDAGDITVMLDRVLLGIFQPTGRLLAFAQAGDDEVQVAGSIDLPAWLYGDAGNDRLKGGAGHDVLFGGDGNDLLAGKSGRDLLVGGVGADRIVGHADDDILVAGYTAFDFDANRRLRAAHEQSISDIMREWTSSRDYAVRVFNLTNSSGGAENGGTYLKTGDGATIFDDDDSDVLTGSSGFDWFFFDSEDDRATDLNDEVFASDLDFILS